MTDTIILTLQEAGYRITDNRKAIAGAVTTQRGLFTVADIIDAEPHIDTVTIYRTIELLESLDIIHVVTETDGHRVYERHSDAIHHIQCERCEKEQTTPCHCQFTSSEFTNIHHITHIKGVCKECVA